MSQAYKQRQRTKRRFKRLVSDWHGEWRKWVRLEVSRRPEAIPTVVIRNEPSTAPIAPKK